MPSPCRFQSFDETTDPATVAPRLKALREMLAAQGLDGFVIPRADEHQGEYVPRHAERLAYVTGFTGSAGTAVVLKDTAALIVDGRYTLQSAEQTDTSLITPVRMEETSAEAWIAAHLPKGAVLGYDPWLHTVDGVARLEKAVRTAQGTLRATDSNPVDSIWDDQPAAPAAPVTLHPLEMAGENAISKISRIQQALAHAKVDGLVISDPHALAWTFNIRGGDVSNTPLPLGYALVPRAGKPTIFMAEGKLSSDIRLVLESFAMLAEPDALADTLAGMAANGAKIRLDSSSAASALATLVTSAGGIADNGSDPTALMKATKNPAELAGARAAHLRDGAAMARFLAWLSTEAPKGKLTEIDAAAQLEMERIATGKLKDLSFTSISAAGPNAALPHYRVNNRSNRRLEPGIYLIDSGGQYQDGTTDITRTLAVGEPSPEMKQRNTLVLKGHIAISTAVFPKGVSGAQLDAFARQYLWQAGLDFDHGTGHGVGSYLSVHEGPQRLSKLGTTPLEPGMILSNEPGYYKPGEYGIRIENLLVVEKREVSGAEREMHGFEVISWCPIDQALIDVSLLTPDEIAWLDDYHRQVSEKIGPLVEASVKTWLDKATQPLAR